MSKGILFISDSIFTSEKELSLTDLVNDQGLRTLYALRKLIKKKDENIANLWRQLQKVEKQFFHLDESTIKSPVSDAISQFYNEARENRHIDNAILERIFIGNTDVEIIDILDTIDDVFIHSLYHRIIQKKKLYESFYLECYSLSNRIANAIDSSNNQTKNNKIDSKEDMLLKCFSKDCNMKSAVKTAARHDVAICILSEDDLDMKRVFVKKFPEIKNVIVVPSELLHNHRKDSIDLYIDLCSQLDGYDYFYLIDDHEDNIEAAKFAGWGTSLFDSSDFKTGKKLEKKLTQEIKKLVSEKDREKLYKKALFH